MGTFGKHKQEGEEVGQPQVVGSDGGVLLGRQVRLVYETPGSLALQLGLDVGGAVNPTIGPGMGPELIQSRKVLLESIKLIIKFNILTLEF